MDFTFGKRRGVYVDIQERLGNAEPALTAGEARSFDQLDRIYRCTCALLYNYVPTSGHPGGSISSGRIVQGLVFDAMDYDVSNPDRRDADILSYAAGHKAMGLYAMWALRNEIARIEAPELLPKDTKYQLRLEDLLGFRRNPVTKTSLFRQFQSKSLDGHPTPATPFVRLSTGASGVGVAASLGLAFGAQDHFGPSAPRVHVIEGEGGLTPGRVAEALAAAGTASLSNAVLHVDWNQASIDSERVCRDGAEPGDYVQWDPRELAYLHDWNVIFVPDGKDIQQVIAAQRTALEIRNGQPTAIVYRTIKGFEYGIEGRASHGAGHKLCSSGFYAALQMLTDQAESPLPICESGATRCQSGSEPNIVEGCFWDALSLVRKTLEASKETTAILGARLREAQSRLNHHERTARPGAPRVESIYEIAAHGGDAIPEPLKLKPGTSATLRGELGRVLGHYNRKSNGAILVASADLLSSTSVSMAAAGFPEGFYHSRQNPEARVLSTGGICEDAMSGILSGVSAFGHNIGAGSSYGAFMAPLGHISARLHAIGNQARQGLSGDPYNPFFLICAHTGLKTGEDGPTHADPQALQLLQGNFPKGTMITLVPWDPQELWYLVTAALAKRPAVIAPFVTRPNETILDRRALGLADAKEATQGVYALRRSKGKGDGVVVLQGSGVTYAFVQEALPLLEREGVDLTVYYVASEELFDMLPASEQERIFPEEHARAAMGITGLTLPTLYRWVTSARGRAASLHPFREGHFLGSGQAERVLEEAELDGRGQLRAIMSYLRN